MIFSFLKTYKQFENLIPKWKERYIKELDKEEIGYTLQPFEIIEYITSFHDMDSYDDSDFYERCEKYNYFVVEYIDTNKIDLDEYQLDEYKVDEYIDLYKQTNKYPTIVVGETENDNYTIIDGLHRANALNRLGFEKIKAYVGKVNLNERDSFSAGGAFPGPPIVNQAADILAAGGSDGMIGGGAGFGQTGAMGGEFPKKFSPSTPQKTPYKQKIKNIKTKESRRRKNALKKLKKLDKIKLKNFNDFQKD